MSAARFTDAGKFDRLYDHEKRLAAMRDAAPELYEALSALLAFTEEDYDGETIFGHCHAALARARGEQ